MDLSVYCLFCLMAFVPARNCFNLRHITGDLRRTAGDLRRTTSRLIVKKTSHHSPPIFNINAGPNLPQITSPILPWRLSDKPPPMKKGKCLSKRSAIKHKLLKIKRLRRLPKLPKLPILPILPPIIPKLPLLPLPFLPIISPLSLLPPILPSVSKLLKPLRVPIISKSRLQKALGSELTPVSIPAQNISRKNILQKLLNLKNRGTLTAAQVKRLKNVLL